MKKKRRALARSAICLAGTACFLWLSSANPEVGHAQIAVCPTFQITTPTTIPISGVRAGDTVMIDATLITDDIFDFLEGEPLVLSSPGLGTQTISLPFGALTVTTHFTFTAVQNDETINASIVGFDGDETGSVSVCLDRLAITVADIRSDTIRVVLPSGGPGRLVLTLIGDTTVPLFDGVLSSGTHTFSFRPLALPEGHYDQVKAVWTVNGSPSEATKAVAFRVLGKYRHSQYNVPAESSCGGTPVRSFITDDSCSFTETMLRSMFISQVNLNGSGRAINFGDVRSEMFCAQPSRKPPPGSINRSFRQREIHPSCSGLALDNFTVARRPNHPFLDCGDEVLIVGVGSGVGTVKTVTDLCPGCPVTQLDNFTTDPACSHIGDVGVGRFVTIRLR